MNGDSNQPFVLSYLWHVLIALKGRAYQVFIAQVMYVQSPQLKYVIMKQLHPL